MSFSDRADAGRRLAEALRGRAAEHDVVMALPRGGVPVAIEVAEALHAPLDVLAVRKLGAPGRPEYGVGAIAEGGIAVVDRGTVATLGVSEVEIQRILRREERELRRRVEAYRDGRPAEPVIGRTVLVVDDGLATGLTMIAAVRSLRSRGAARIVVAVPVGSTAAVADLREEADEVVCLATPEPFRAVSVHYDDFAPVRDDEVVALLSAAWGDTAPPARMTERRGWPLTFDLDGRTLRADLVVPFAPRGLVVFAHGSGSSRLSPRNRVVARRLQEAGFATVLVDLLDDREAGRSDRVVDIPELAERLAGIVSRLREQPLLGRLPLGLFGASAGAGVALAVAADLGADVHAVVSRGGRPDLATERLAEVVAPTLLIVGGADPVVLAVNRRAARLMTAPCELAVVPEAGHLFEEPGALEEVAELATAWFERRLAGGTSTTVAAGGGAS